MRLLRSFCALVTLSAALFAGTGCAGAVDEDAGEGSASAVRQSTYENAAGALSVDYGLGILAARRFETIPRDELVERLPEGDARVYAQCLERRNDIVKGETLRGKTWDYEGARYFVLATDLEDSAEMRDVEMLFAFSSDGVSRFQILVWGGKRNFQVSYRQGTPCTG